MGRLDRFAAAGHVDAVALAAFPAAGEAAVTLDPGHLVLAEQHLDADGQLGDDLVLARLHFLHVHLRAGHRNAVRSELVRHALVILRGFEQRLGGNAAHVEAGAAKSVFALVVLPVIDASGGKTKLRRADRSDVSGRTGTDYHYIE